MAHPGFLITNSPLPCLARALKKKKKSLDLVVTTIMLVMLVKHALVKWRGNQAQREGKAVGFSCVIFAYMTYLAVAMRQFCPMGEGFSTLCFETWSIPMFGGACRRCVQMCPGRPALQRAVPR